MSHFSRIQTKLRDMETLKEALLELGYAVQEGPVRGYMGQRTNADLVIHTDSNYDIGFRQEKDSIVVIADFWGLRMNRDEFLKSVSQRYAYLTVNKQAAARGWQMMSEEVQEDGSIRLVMQRWS